MVLPYESHGYIARESVLHMLAEQFGWLERWLGSAPAPAGAVAATSAQPMGA